MLVDLKRINPQYPEASSKTLTASLSSLTSTAFSRSANCAVLVALAIGAATAGRVSSQAMAICAVSVVLRGNFV